MSTTFAQARETLRPDLGQTMELIDRTAQLNGLVGLSIFPLMDVLEQSGTFTKLPIEAIIPAVPNTARASDGSYTQINGKVTQDSYATSENGLQERVDERDKNLWRSYWDGEKLAADRVTLVNLLAHTMRVVTAVTNDVTATAAASAVWTNAATANPINDVLAGKLAMRNSYGIRPNAICMDMETFDYCRKTNTVLDAARGQLAERDAYLINAAILAQVLGLEEVIISDSQKNTANEAKAAVLSTVWDKTKVLLFRKSSGRDLRDPQLGRTFAWSADGGNVGEQYESYYSNELRSDVIRGRMDTQEKVLYPAAGRWITGVQT